MEFLDVEYFKNILSPESFDRLKESLIIVAVVWFAMKGKVKALTEGISKQVNEFQQHLDKIEQAILMMAANVKELKESLESLEKNHSQRIDALEDGLTQLKTKVSDLEKPKE